MKFTIAVLLSLTLTEARLHNTEIARELGKNKNKKNKNKKNKNKTENVTPTPPETSSPIKVAPPETLAPTTSPVKSPTASNPQPAGNVFDGVCSFAVGDTFETIGCNFDTVAEATECSAAQLKSFIGLANEEEVYDYIANSCTDALSDEVDDYGYEGFPFEDVMAKGYIWDTNFFNGGTAYNSIEDNSTVADQSIRIQAVADQVASSQIIGFPGERIPNFQNCEKNAAMCCYVSKKNDDGTNGEPTDNTDICHHDMSNSERSARTNAGYAYFHGDDEGDAYCEGFAWDDDVDGPYKGNSLFHVAMEKGLLQNQYTRAVPGAPMCACIEQMPVVSKAKCTKTEPIQTFEVVSDSGNLGLKLTTTVINFSDCGDDLADYYSTKFPGESISDYVVGTCPDVPPFFAELNYVRSDNSWIPMWGKRKLEHDMMDEDTARDLINNDGENFKMVKRRCVDCDDTHVNIYYKRLTAIPADLNIVEILLNTWTDVAGNEFNKDFKLYSTYLDAVQDKDAWRYCNFGITSDGYSDGVGFPRECGPDRRTYHQWNSHDKWGAKNDVLFTIEK